MSEPAAEIPISDARDSLADVVPAPTTPGGSLRHPARAAPRPIVPAEVAEAIERAEDAADVVAARDALARIDAGDSPIPLAELRDELGL